MPVTIERFDRTPIEVAKGSREYFIIFGDGLMTKGLDFYASKDAAGAHPDKEVTISVDGQKTSTDKRVAVVVLATIGAVSGGRWVAVKNSSGVKKTMPGLVVV